MAQSGLQRAIGPLDHRWAQGTVEAMTAEWAQHPLAHLIGEQCLYVNLVSA